MRHSYQIDSMKIPAFIPATLMYVLILALSAYTVYKKCGDVFYYTLDDPYIHMAIAKNLVTEGRYSATHEMFSSSSSSPAWVLILFITYKLFGVSDKIPLILNILISILILIAANELLTQLGVSYYRRVVVEIILTLLTPLVPLTYTGMEHNLHLLIVLLFYSLSIRAINGSRAAEIYSIGIAALSTAIRYESLFIIVGFVIHSLVKRRFIYAFLLSMGSIALIAIYGVISLRNGASFLPNPIVLKGDNILYTYYYGMQEFLYTLITHGLRKVINYPIAHLCLGSLAISAVLMTLNNHSLKDLSYISILAMIIHGTFGSFGWFFRYEAYIVLIAIIFSSSSIDIHYRFKKVSVYVLICILMFAAVDRIITSHCDIRRASFHIYSQQIQMALFIDRFFSYSDCVAINDLGAVAYYSNTRILDLFGLGTDSVARTKEKWLYDSNAIRYFVKQYNVRAMIVYRDWFKSIWPEEYIHVADWSLKQAYHGRVVSFYAPDRISAKRLLHELMIFENRLPQNVNVKYYDFKQQ